MMEGDSIKIDKFENSDQWNSWKFQIKILLSAGDVFDVVKGDEVKPVKISGQTDAVHSVAVKDWQKKDNKAQKIIVTTIGKQPMMHIINCNTSNEMWIKLQSVYEQKSKTNIHLIQQRFYSFKKDPLDDMAIHIYQSLNH